MAGTRRLDSIINRLKQSGCRITPQRLAVVKILIDSCEHPTVEQIYQQVRDDFPTTSLATVYKIVNLLKEMGEIRELDLQGDRHRYDGRTADPHPHVICTRCRTIMDAQIPDWGRFAREAEASTGYRILDQRLEFFGVCPSCAEVPHS